MSPASESLPERVALVHYHLRGGGVARVLEHQQAVLDEAGVEHCILVGEAPPADCALRGVVVVEGLGYADPGDPREPLPESEVERIVAAARRRATERLGGPPDLWHIHNHGLGKNALQPTLAHRLAEGAAVLLQPHDLAEDGRPENYARLRAWRPSAFAGLGAWLYPNRAGVHYAFINGRDRAFLADAGMPEARLHALPNAVHFDTDALAAAEVADVPSARGARLLLYPTRAIRRKNLGELLLWAATARNEVGRRPTRFGVTLAPKNPEERPLYERWVALAEELALPIDFELGGGHDFFGLMKRADGLVTTSVAEGFGLAFLEPMLVGKSLAGRNLPEVTGDFTRLGVDLTGLYRRILTPVAWLPGGVAALRERIATALTESFSQYGRRVGAEDCKRALAAALGASPRAPTPSQTAEDGEAGTTGTGGTKGKGGTPDGPRAPSHEQSVDFGRLDPELQEAVIRHVVADPVAGMRLRERFGESMPADRVAHNREVVERTFSLAGYADRLLQVYRAVWCEAQARGDGGDGAEAEGRGDAGGGGEIDGEALLTSYLDPARFFLLRS